MQVQNSLLMDMYVDVPVQQSNNSKFPIASSTAVDNSFRWSVDCLALCFGQLDSSELNQISVAG